MNCFNGFPRPIPDSKKIRIGSISVFDDLKQDMPLEKSLGVMGYLHAAQTAYDICGGFALVRVSSTNGGELHDIKKTTGATKVKALTLDEFFALGNDFYVIGNINGKTVSSYDLTLFTLINNITMPSFISDIKTDGTYIYVSDVLNNVYKYDRGLNLIASVVPITQYSDYVYLNLLVPKGKDNYIYILFDVTTTSQAVAKINKSTMTVESTSPVYVAYNSAKPYSYITGFDPVDSSIIMIVFDGTWTYLTKLDTNMRELFRIQLSADDIRSSICVTIGKNVLAISLLYNGISTNSSLVQVYNKFTGLQKSSYATPIFGANIGGFRSAYGTDNENYIVGNLDYGSQNMRLSIGYYYL